MDIQISASGFAIDLLFNGKPIDTNFLIALICATSFILTFLMMPAETWPELRKKALIYFIFPVPIGLLCLLASWTLHPAFFGIVVLSPVYYIALIPGIAIAFAICSLRLSKRLKARAQGEADEQQGSSTGLR